MKIFIGWLIFVLFISCTVTKYNETPVARNINLNSEKLIVWQFQHPNWDISESSTQKITNKLKVENCYDIIEYDSIIDICYRYMINFNDSVSAWQLKLLNNITGARYLLLSEVVDKSKKKGVIGPFLFEYEKDLYYPFPKDEGRWLTYQFQFYDLVNQECIYNLNVKVSAFKYESETSSGDVWRYYSLSASNLNKIALRKGIKKIKKNIKMQLI
jgi:hypothetical protein